MSEFSKVLRDKRESLNLSLSDISKAIKVTTYYLELIEKGEFNKLPSYVHAYGFSKSYAEYLGFNFDELKPLFDEACKKDDFQKKYVKIESDEIIQKEVNLKNIHKFFVFFIIVVILIIALVYYFLNVNKKQVIKNLTVENKTANVVPLENETVNSDNSSKDIKAIVEEKIDKIDPKEIVEQINKKEVADNETFHEAVLEFNDICWVNIKIDNETVLDFIANPGTKKSIKFKKYFLIDIGNAAALTIKYDNLTFSRFGGFRQPVKNLYFTVNEDNYLMYEKVK